MKNRYLGIIYITCLILSNITANRIGLAGNLNIAGNPFLYIACFFICDVINEEYGEKQARFIVNAGFLALLIASIAIYSTYLIPAQDKNFDTAFKTVFNNSWRIIIASFSAYLISNHIDISIFSFIRKRNKNYLLRKIASTAISQFFDSLIFVIVAFYGILPESDIVNIITSEYLIKFCINIIDMPFYFLCIKNKEKTK